MSHRSILTVHGRDYVMCDLEAFWQSQEAKPNLSSLPVSLKILAEGLLRHPSEANGPALQALMTWGSGGSEDTEISFYPSRILMQDFTGVPALVDLASLRDASRSFGLDPLKIQPKIPVDLVIDHAVVAQFSGTQEALSQNQALEFRQNHERYSLLKWGAEAFQGVRVIPPGKGICHQINLECLAPGIHVSKDNLVYPDTVIGTDSHTTMINSLGVLGWGVGGIEAEAAMLGMPLRLLIPRVVGVCLNGHLPDGVLATDFVLTLTHILRKSGVVGAFVEFWGDGLDHLPLPDRATLANMAPEFGATCAFFPVDDLTLDYLKLTGRPPETVDLLEAYAKAQGLWRGSTKPLFSQTIDIDLETIRPTLAGPKRPQDRVFLSDLSASLEDHLPTKGCSKTPDELCHGDLVIAAITSCTNTSNPTAMIAAGLLAQKAVELGLTSQPWVKTSLAPGSQVVTDYLKILGLDVALDALGFQVVGYGCTTCIGNSGDLNPQISQQIQEKDLTVCGILSGNRNFEGRIHPLVKLNYLASPPLVVAFALAGTLYTDLTTTPIGTGPRGKKIFLKDIWPTTEEIQKAITRALTKDLYERNTAELTSGTAEWEALDTPRDGSYPWDPQSTYIEQAPYFETLPLVPSFLEDIKGARILVMLGDSITTDHISPASVIAPDSDAGIYLKERGVQEKDFNSYGARRGAHSVMVRGTFANPRLSNELSPLKKGGYTKHSPSGETLTIFQAAERYKASKTPLIVIAGKEYGSGSSRDWAAKGPKLLGVHAVLAESFERIHRSNLIGMGILPLLFQKGMTRQDLNLQGDEIIDILGLVGSFSEKLLLTLRIQSSEKTFQLIPIYSDIRSPGELVIVKNGGILPLSLRTLIRAQKENNPL